MLTKDNTECHSPSSLSSINLHSRQKFGAHMGALLFIIFNFYLLL